MKTLIIGNSGSGKTTLATKLSVESEVPYYELDEIMWIPGECSQKRTVAERNRIVTEILKNESWIVEGVFGDLAELFVDFADELIWLDKTKEECLSNLDKRGPSYNKIVNSDEAEKSFLELKEWASKYWERSGSCCVEFHKNLYQNFKRDKKRLK